MLRYIHQVNSEITSTGTTYLMTISHQPPRVCLCLPLLTSSERKRAGPKRMTAKEIKAPETKSPTDHTKSWFVKTSSERAEGAPIRSPVRQIKVVAFLRQKPISTNTRLASSIIDIREVNAAKVNPRKNRMA